MSTQTRRQSRRRKLRLNRTHALIAAAIIATVGLAGGSYYVLSRKDPDDYLAAARTQVARGDRQAAIIELKNALQLAPEDAALRYELGKLYVAGQDYAAAEKELTRARDGGHSADDLPALLARALIGQRQPKRVLDEIPVPEGARPELAAPLLALRARAQLMLGDKAAAEQSLREADALRPDHPETLVTRAQLAVAAGDRANALTLIDRAIAGDGKRADLWMMKGDLLRLEKQTEPARAAYRRALELDPEQIGAHLAIGLLHLERNELDQAQAQLAQADKLVPNHPMARYLGAVVDFRRGHHNEAKTKLQEVLKVAPDLLPAQLLAGATEFALGNRQSAIGHLGKVLERVPDHPYARKLMAAAMVSAGQLDEAQRLVAGLGDDDLLSAVLQGDIALRKRDFAAARQHLEQAAALAPDNPALLVELARSRMASGDSAGAIEALNRAAELDTASGRPDALLVLTHLRAGRPAEAMAAAERLVRERPKDPLGYFLIGQVHLARRDLAGAKSAFSEALKQEPTYLPAATELARMDLQANDRKAARGRFEAILAKDPRNSRALIALAGLAADQKDEKAYLDYLTRAKQANPKDPAAYELLAAYWLQRRDAAKALVEAKAGLDMTGQARFHDAMGAAQLMQNDRDAALATYQLWVKAAPENPMAHFRLAQVQRARGDSASALQSLGRALAISPDATELLAVKAVTLAEVGRAEDGLRLARSLQQKAPKSPTGLMAEGDILVHGKKPAAAAEAYAKAARLGNSGALAATAYRNWVAAGQQKQADAFLQQWIKERPNDGVARHTLADGLLKSGRLSEAQTQYELLYKANPRDLIAANNLAWIYGELKDPRALPQAEAAYALAPEHPSTLDTLGWILVQQGQTQRGRTLLEKAHERSPDAPDIHWHLAVALAKSGDTPRALTELERLLNSGRDFANRQAAIQYFHILKHRP